MTDNKYKFQLSMDIVDILNRFKDISIYAHKLLYGADPSDLILKPVDFISVSVTDPTKISYVAFGETSNWSDKKRTSCRPGVFLNKIFKNVSDKDIETFSNLYRTFSNTVKYRFEVVKGESIRKYYNGNYHAEQRGPLGASCMRYDRCGEFMDLYAQNECVSMLIMFNERNLILGRAILWEFGDIRIMDRVYTISKEEWDGVFFEWAVKHNFLYKKNQNWFDTVNFGTGVGKETIEARFEIKLKNFKYRKYPYLDTFKWLDINTGIIRNYLDTDRSNIVLCKDNGSHEYDSYYSFDDIDRVYRNTGDMVTVNGLCTTQANCRWSNIYNLNILSKEAIYLDKIDDYVYLDDSRNNNVLIEERVVYLKRMLDEYEEMKKKKKKIEKKQSIEDLFTVTSSTRSRMWQSDYSNLYGSTGLFNMTFSTTSTGVIDDGGFVQPKAVEPTQAADDFDASENKLHDSPYKPAVGAPRDYHIGIESYEQYLRELEASGYRDVWMPMGGSTNAVQNEEVPVDITNLYEAAMGEEIDIARNTDSIVEKLNSESAVFGVEPTDPESKWIPQEFRGFRYFK